MAEDTDYQATIERLEAEIETLRRALGWVIAEAESCIGIGFDKADQSQRLKDAIGAARKAGS